MIENIPLSVSYSLDELNSIVQKYVYSKTDNSYNGKPVYPNLDDHQLGGECWRPYSTIIKATDTDFNFRTNMQKEDVGKYEIQVSNIGRIKVGKSVNRQMQNKFGWLYVNITPKIKYYVYRLVAEVWNDCPVENTTEHAVDSYWTVHHLTNNGFDNRPSNLIWLSKEQHDAIKHNAQYKNELIRQDIEDTLKKALTLDFEKQEILLMVEDILSFSKIANPQIVDSILIKYNINKDDYPFINWKNCLTNL